MENNLRENDIEYLLEESEEMLRELDEDVDTLLNGFNCSGNYYRLYEFSDEFIVALRRGNGGATINVGFPFPVRFKPLPGYKNCEKIGVTLNVFLRGEKIRQKQRGMLDDMGIEIKDVNRHFLRKISNIRANGAMIYVDPYDFIGDSVIGIHFPDVFSTRYSPSRTMVVSKAKKHLDYVCESASNDIEAIDMSQEDIDVAIMPDMIDNQWGATMRTLRYLGKSPERPKYIFIPGRNILVINNRNGAYALHVDADDPLLRNQNIEDYMNSCIEPFTDVPTISGKALVQRRSGKYIINPFGSFRQKEVPVMLTVNVCKAILSKPDSVVYVVGGSRDNRDHSIWIENFIEMLSSGGRLLDRIRVRYYDDLSHLCEEVEYNGIASALTADTSIAHLLNKLSIPNITLYNELMWDSHSVQSMTSDSPLGFCRFGSQQYPVILGKNVDISRPLSKTISDGLFFLAGEMEEENDRRGLSRYGEEVKKFLKEGIMDSGWKRKYDSLCKTHQDLRYEHNDDSLSWVFDSYSPEMTLFGIIEYPHDRISNLVASAFRNSPAYKLFLSGV